MPSSARFVCFSVATMVASSMRSSLARPNGIGCAGCWLLAASASKKKIQTRMWQETPSAHRTIVRSIFGALIASRGKPDEKRCDAASTKANRRHRTNDNQASHLHANRSLMCRRASACLAFRRCAAKAKGCRIRNG